MAGAAGPNTVESGLVFAYDTGNTITSYLGEPLVNCATDLSSGYNITVTEVTDRSITPPFPGMRVYKFITANNYNLHRQGGYYNGGGFGGSNPQPLILGTTTPSNFTTVGTGKYRFGMYIRGEVTNQVGDGVTIDIGDRNQVGTTVGTNTNWQLIQTDDTLGIADSNYPYDFFDIGASFNMTFYVSGYGIWRSPGTVTSLPFLQAYPTGTQYITYGQSRSVTEGLLDMTRNSTINLTDVSFSGSGEVVFDGTNDYINVPYNSTQNLTSQGTISVWIYPFSVTQGNFAGLVAQCTGGSVNTQAYHLSWRQISGAMYGSICNGSGTYDEIYAALPTVANIWYNIVFTWNGSQLNMYNNSVVIGTTTQTINSQVLATDLTIGGYTYKGAGGAGEYFNGKIANVEIYNRGLSATEIKQNFEAIRDRFGI